MYLNSIRLLTQQLSDVMAICEENVKDIHTIACARPKQLMLVDAIGNYREIPFDFCVSYEVRLTLILYSVLL
jgi:hypothetical protein